MAEIDAQHLNGKDRVNAVRRMNYRLRVICSDVLNVKDGTLKSAAQYHGWIWWTQQAVLPPKSHVYAKESLPYDLEVRPQSYSVGWYQALAMTEHNGNKINSCVPLFRSCIPNHITLDSQSVGELLWDCNTIDKKKKSSVARHLSRNHEALWSRVFKLSDNVLKHFRNYEFNYMIHTNGVACSLMFRRPDIVGTAFGMQLKSEEPPELYIHQLSEEQKMAVRMKDIVCGDPGGNDLLHCVAEIGAQSPETMK